MGEEAAPAIPGYRILRTLGEGGMGTVYEAEKLSTHEIFAVKLVRGQLADDPTYVRRFVREVEALRAIRHPNVVNVFEWSVQGGRGGVPAYVVMEYLEGESLDDRVRRERRLDPAQAVPIMLQVLEGLAAAHGIGILHRDMGPSNVFLQRGPRDQVRVRLLDFGLARPLGEEPEGPQLTQEGTVMGKPGYVAPEMIEGGELDGRSDLFACGMLLYRMLAGRLPFDASSSQLLWVERWAERRDPREYRPPSDFVPQIPEALDVVVRRAVRRRPADRFGSAREMQQALLEAEKRIPVVPRAATGFAEARDLAPPARAADAASHTAAARTRRVRPPGPRATASTRIAQAIALGAAAIILAFLLIRWTGGRDDAEEPAATPRAASPSPVPGGDEVRLVFRDLPPDARVLVAGQPVHDPQAGHRLPRSTVPVDVFVEVPAGGYGPWTGLVVPERDIELRPVLPPLPSSPPPPDPSAAVPDARDAGAAVPGADAVEGGTDVVPAPPDAQDAAATDAARTVRREAGRSTAAARDGRTGGASTPRDAARVEGRHGTRFETEWR